MDYNKQANTMLDLLTRNYDASIEEEYIGTMSHHAPEVFDLLAAGRSTKPIYTLTSTRQRGATTREDASLARYHFIMVDDVGTKVSEPALVPTTKVETSPGNYQWCYALTEPLSIDEGREFCTSFKGHGIGDDAAFTVGRLVKLPGSCRGKEPEYRARLVDYNEVSYTAEELIDAFGLDAPAPVSKTLHGTPGSSGMVQGALVRI